MAQQQSSSSKTTKITLDLQPEVGQLGELRALDNSRIAQGKRGSAFSYDIEITNEIHGLVTRKAPGSKPKPGSVILITATVKARPGARIKNSTIEITFRNSASPEEPKMQPTIHDYELGSKEPLFMCSSTEVATIVNNNIFEPKANVMGFGASLGQLGQQTTGTRVRTFSTTVSSYSEPERGPFHYPHNRAKWICSENTKRHSGVPPVLGIGLLLERKGSGPIDVHVKVRAEVSWRQTFKDWMKDFAWWTKENEWIPIDPANPDTSPPDKIPDKDHLEIVTPNENELLKSMCYIRMPKEYMLCPVAVAEGENDNAENAEEAHEDDEEEDDEEDEEEEDIIDDAVSAAVG